MDHEETPFAPVGVDRISGSEVELVGGTNPGVVRVGDTVRRPARAWTPTVKALLCYLEQVDFPAPRPLTADDDARQVTIWIAGETTWDEHARYWAEPEQLARVAGLVRRLHDLLDGFEAPSGAVWRDGWGRGAAGVGPICHWDLAPYNVVASPNGDLSIIDFDGAGPGDRMRELAYAIDSFVLLRRDATCFELGYQAPPARVDRIETFWQNYGLPASERTTLADALVANAHDRLAFGEQMYAERREPWASFWAVDRGAGDREDLVVTERAARAWLARYRTDPRASEAERATRMRPPSTVTRQNAYTD